MAENTDDLRVEEPGASAAGVDGDSAQEVLRLDDVRAEGRVGGRGRLAALMLDYAALVAVLIVLVAVFSLRSRSFFSYDQFSAIINPNLPMVLVAVGMTYVLIIGGIDLSVGSVMALSGAVIGVLFESQRFPLPLAILGGVATGLACGLVNGLVVIRWNLPSFIVTLGMLQIARGATHLITASQKPSLLFSSINVLSDPLSWAGGLPPTFFVTMLVVVAGQLVLSWTVFGRYMIAVGTNEEAVRLSGVDVRPVKLSVFVISSLLATLAGILTLSRHRFADPNVGRDLELEVIAAVVVGGTSLMGGRGTVIGSFLGLLIIVVLGAGLAALGTRDEVKRLVTGFVIVGAVILDYYRHRLGQRSERAA